MWPATFGERKAEILLHSNFIALLASELLVEAEAATAGHEQHEEATGNGNVLAEEEQWAKLKMVVDLAREVWG